MNQLQNNSKININWAKIRLIALVPVVLISSSCSSSPSWSCRNLDSKVGCANISKADDVYLKNDQLLSLTNINANIDFTAHANSKTKEELVRLPEQIGRIWIAPYLDAKGNYHEASYIRIVDVGGRWQNVAMVDELKPTNNYSNVSSNSTQSLEQNADVKPITNQDDNKDGSQKNKNPNQASVNLND